jgi:hypothetical protein
MKNLQKERKMKNLQKESEKERKNFKVLLTKYEI